MCRGKSNLHFLFCAPLMWKKSVRLFSALPVPTEGGEAARCSRRTLMKRLGAFKPSSSSSSQHHLNRRRRKERRRKNTTPASVGGVARTGASFKPARWKLWSLAAHSSAPAAPRFLVSFKLTLRASSSSSTFYFLFFVLLQNAVDWCFFACGQTGEPCWIFIQTAQ